MQGGSMTAPVLCDTGIRFGSSAVMLCSANPQPCGFLVRLDEVELDHALFCPRCGETHEDRIDLAEAVERGIVAGDLDYMLLTLDLREFVAAALRAA